MEAKADTLVHQIGKHYKGYSVECNYEAYRCGYHIYRDLTKAGWKVIVINPGDMPRQTSKAQTRVTRQTVAICAITWLRSSQKYKPSRGKAGTVPQPVRRRADLVKSLRRIKCHIKSMLYYGIDLPEHYDNIKWSKVMTPAQKSLHGFGLLLAER